VASGEVPLTNVYDNIAILHSVEAALAGRDVEAIVELFTIDCVLVGFTGPLDVHVGRDAVRSVVRSVVDSMPTARFELVGFALEADQLGAEFLVREDAEGQMTYAERRYRLADPLI
jgi:uncharacterized protein (TIGR02246 family)